MKVPELRTKLKELGLDSKGLKAELIQRINAHREALRKNRISNNDDRDEDEDDDSEENGDDESEKGEVDDNGEDEDYEELIEVVTNNKVVNSIVEKVKKLTKRGKNAAYNFTAKFDKIEDALNTVIDEKLWIKGTKKETISEGLRQNYLCTFHKSAKCEAKCYLLYHNDSGCVSLFNSEHQHNDHIKLSDHGITEHFKQAIDNIYEVYKKPAQIKRQLINMYPNIEKELFPSEQQLVNYLKYKRKQAGMKTRLN
jgi:hypothetical protein